MQLASPSGRAV